MTILEIRRGLLAACLVAFHCCAIADVIYVNSNAAGANTGVSWVNAFTNLQTALANAPAGSEIWVAKGTYLPGATRLDCFVLRGGVALYGGFIGTESVLTNRSWLTNPTILSGNIGTTNTLDNTYHVLRGATGSILDGFTITGGNADGAYPHNNGAGLFNSNASPIVANCTFTSNQTARAGSGAGIYNLNSSPSIVNSSFLANAGYWGGGICNLEGSSPVISNCLFRANTADYGAGIHDEASSPVIKNCTLTANSGDGAGIFLRNSRALIEGCAFSSNNAHLWNGAGITSVAANTTVRNGLFTGNTTPEGAGAGMKLFRGSVVLMNCTFTGNAAPLNSGGGVHSEYFTLATIQNCILWNNTALLPGAEIFADNGTLSVSYSDIEGGVLGAKVAGSGIVDLGNNLNSNPRFVNPLSPAGSDGLLMTSDDGLRLDAQLAISSPCIDAGKSTGAPVSDIIGLSRPQDFGFDMGAYEYDPDFDRDGVENLLEYRLGANANDPDSDEDGIADALEYYTHGSNLASNDTDGDGMLDGWEVANRLNPRFNDASLDLDLDGVTNFRECQNQSAGYHANLADSFSDGQSDYERLFLKSPERYTYDKTDRLIGAEYNHGAEGFSIAYFYDGNSNIRRQKHLTRDGNHNGLPDLWEALNSLTNSASAFSDTDGDGWTDHQEWLTGSDPRSTNSIPGTNVIQTAPLARIMAEPSQGSGAAIIQIVLWDAEGNDSLPFMQYSNALTAAWTNATLVLLDGTDYLSFDRGVSAPPTGAVHQVVWDAAFDLGTHSALVSLRASAQDISTHGPWSEPVSYLVSMVPPDDGDGMPDSWEIHYFGNNSRDGNGDYDRDGFTDLQEYIADTDPTNNLSFLRVTLVQSLTTGFSLHWQGGIEATQVVQRLEALGTNLWQNIWTGLPPTPVTGSYTDLWSTNSLRFYRIEATR